MYNSRACVCLDRLFRCALQEVEPSAIDTNSAYILFYERQGLTSDKYIPDVSKMKPDLSDIDDECENEIKKVCVIQ